MANQINEKSKKSYKEDSSTNAVKLLSMVDSFNGYIRVYTELNSNFKADDTVYISSMFNVKYTGFTLDNFIENNLDDYPYTDYANGYKVLRVKNNEIVIDRPYRFDTTPTLENHYISKISFNIGNFNKGELNSVLFKQVEMSPDSMDDIIFDQAIALSGTVSDTLILDKYDYHYISRNTSIGNGPPVITYSFNNTYSYNYFENIRFVKCSFKNGYYDNCVLTTPPTDINNSNYPIENGYYDSCTISKHDINGGYIKDCDLDAFCEWNYGYWNNATGGDFGPSTWNDGIWIYGSFINGKTWITGEFKKGQFMNSTWHNGIFNGIAQDYYTYLGLIPSQTKSIFHNSTWLDGTFNGGQFNESEWVTGTFTNGYISDSCWSGGTFNNGQLKNTIWKNGTFNDGSFGVDDDGSDSIWYRGHFNGGIIETSWMDGYFNNGTIQNSTWATGTFTDGIFYKSTWNDGIWYNGTFNQSDWNNGTWYNGVMQGTDLDGSGLITASNWYNGDWHNGQASNGTFHNVNWSGGTATNVTMGLQDSVINWYDGSFSGSKFGWASMLREYNSIPMPLKSPGSIINTNPQRYFAFGELTGSTAYLYYQKLLTWLGHNGEEGVVMFYGKSYVCTNIQTGWISPDTMTFYGESEGAMLGDFDINFSSIYTGFTGNWYGGSFDGGLFFGNWYDGQYYNSTWYGRNIGNGYYEPSKFGIQNVSSAYQDLSYFVQENTNLPPETNSFNPQNQGFQDPTYFD